MGLFSEIKNMKKHKDKIYQNVPDLIDLSDDSVLEVTYKGLAMGLLGPRPKLYLKWS